VQTDLEVNKQKKSLRRGRVQTDERVPFLRNPRTCRDRKVISKLYPGDYVSAGQIIACLFPDLVTAQEELFGEKNQRRATCVLKPPKET
jgi:hypothetical protein